MIFILIPLKLIPGLFWFSVEIFSCFNIEGINFAIVPDDNVGTAVDKQINFLCVPAQLFLNQVAKERMLLAFIVSCFDPVIGRP